MLDEIKDKENVIALIARSAVSEGVTLLGGISGVGKTVTASAVLDYIKDNNMFAADRILYINTRAEKARGGDIESHIKALAGKSASDRILVVLDEVYHRDSVDIALWLAQQGHSVLGVVQTPPTASSKPVEQSGLSSIIVNAVTWVDSEDKASVVGGLLSHLNTLILQDSLAPTCHRVLSLTDTTKKGLLAVLSNHGLYKFYLAVDELKVKERGANDLQPVGAKNLV